MTTITEPEVSRREAAFTEHIERSRLIADVLGRLQGHDVDPPDWNTTFRFDPPAGLTDDEQVAAARDFLARHRHAFLAVARDLGHHVIAEKFEHDDTIGVRVKLPRGTDSTYGYPVYLLLDAEVRTEVTCELVDTGEVRTIPAQPERTEPVLERRCPESLFRSVADDALCTGLRYEVNPGFPDEGHDIRHEVPCPVHQDALEGMVA